MNDKINLDLLSDVGDPIIASIANSLISSEPLPKNQKELEVYVTKFLLKYVAVLKAVKELQQNKSKRDDIVNQLSKN